jgi:hypothetical protein
VVVVAEQLVVVAQVVLQDQVDQVVVLPRLDPMQQTQVVQAPQVRGLQAVVLLNKILVRPEATVVQVVVVQTTHHQLPIQIHLFRAMVVMDWLIRYLVPA